MREDRVAFLLLFCGMVLVKRRRADLAETMSMLPLSWRGRLLATEMGHSGAALWQGPRASLHPAPGDQTFHPGDGRP